MSNRERIEALDVFIDFFCFSIYFFANYSQVVEMAQAALDGGIALPPECSIFSPIITLSGNQTIISYHDLNGVRLTSAQKDFFALQASGANGVLSNDMPNLIGDLTPKEFMLRYNIPEGTAYG